MKTPENKNEEDKFLKLFTNKGYSVKRIDLPEDYSGYVSRGFEDEHRSTLLPPVYQIDNGNKRVIFQDFDGETFTIDIYDNGEYKGGFTDASLEEIEAFLSKNDYNKV